MSLKRHAWNSSTRCGFQSRPAQCGLVAVSFFGLLPIIGCAAGSFGWRNPLASRASQSVDLPPDSIAGQVQKIRALVAAASTAPEAQRRLVAETMNAQLASGSTPVAVKAEAIRALGLINVPNAVDGLEAALRESDDNLRTASCISLGSHESSRSVSLLAGVIAKEASNDVRIAAARSLGQFQGTEAVRALGQVLDDPDPAVQLVAMRSLQRSTGAKLGMDVRQWKQALTDPEVLVAGRDASRR